jgi:hypothetical protein
MEPVELVARLLVFLVLGSALLSLIDQTFRLRFSLSVRNMVVVSRGKLGTSLHGVCQAWEDHPFGDGARLAKVVGGTVWICLGILCFPVNFAVRCLITAAASVLLYLWATIWRLAFGCASLLLLGGLLIFALSGSANRAVQDAVNSGAQLAVGAARSSVYNCTVVDPRVLYPLMGGDKAQAENAMLDIFDDLNQENGRYDVAIHYFEDLAAATDLDDDLHSIATNNLGCLRLAQAPVAKSADPGSVEGHASNLALMSAASPGDNSQTDGAVAECMSARQNLDAGNKHPSILTFHNMVVGYAANIFSCNPKPAVVVGRDWIPAFELELQLPGKEKTLLKSVTADIGAGYKVLFGGNESPKDAERIPVSGDAIYCYQLSSVLKRNLALLKGEGALFVDADKPSTVQGVRSFHVASGSENVRLVDSVESFALEFFAPDLRTTPPMTVSLGIWLDDKPATVYQNDVKTTTIVLSPSDWHEIVSIDLPPGRHISDLRIATKDGTLGDTWSIGSVNDEDVFRIDLHPSSITLKRVTCDPAANLIDMTGAVAELKSRVAAADPLRAKEAATLALRLGDPNSKAISPVTWSALCKWGSLAGNAEEMLKRACKVAVQAARIAATHASPEAIKVLAQAYDSQGIAHMLNKESAAAIDDLTLALAFDGDLPNAELRKAWIDDLKSGSVPAAPGKIFDDVTIQLLADE